MSLYEEEFGFTRLRLLVTAVELALGGGFVLLLAAGIRMRGGWLPRAASFSAALAVLSLGALDPGAYVAERSVTRYEGSGRFDVAYLSTLSADAVPALLRLPAGLRGARWPASPRNCTAGATPGTTSTSPVPAPVTCSRRPRPGPAAPGSDRFAAATGMAGSAGKTDRDEERVG